MGSREGGLAAAKTLKQKFGDNFYSVIGAMGGSAFRRERARSHR